jgi:hypothetical protein
MKSAVSDPLCAAKQIDGLENAWIEAIKLGFKELFPFLKGLFSPFRHTYPYAVAA